MRAPLLFPALLSALLAACATSGDIPVSKHISQSGPLKVHPGLLGQPVPAELQDAKLAGAAPAEALRNDEDGLRTQCSVYFDINSTEIKADHDPALRAHARYLARNPAAKVRIEGHADERGSADYNRRLGLKRAENVRAALLGHGAGEQQVIIRSFGESRPKLPGHNETSWAENRRADVVYDPAK